jgi:hypothetical protein
VERALVICGRVAGERQKRIFADTAINPIQLKIADAIKNFSYGAS